MNTRWGPYRIVALHCGKFDYAEVEIDAPVHLIGPNNVGKTSLIALLQFLYLDDQRQMQFARDMIETRRYYFPEKYSYALFECLTPAGFQVVGVHGLGPVRRHEFERYAYRGRIEPADYLDDERRVREPEDTFARLAVKGFKRLEPRHLRAALTGIGDGREIVLNLVPARHAGTYERFRKVFGNILRLSHIRQDELKQLLLDIFRHEFQQPDGIDLARNYATGFEQVRRDAQDVQALKLLQADVERLLRHRNRRDRARAAIPALWQAVGRTFTERKSEYDTQEAALIAERQVIEEESAALTSRLTADHAEARDLAGRMAVARQKLDHIAEQSRRFEGFVPDWARRRQADVRVQLEELVVRIRNAAEESVEQMQQRLHDAERNLAAKQVQLENLTHAVVNHLRKQLAEQDIADAFTVLNPDLLKLPVNAGKPGICMSDDERAAGLIGELLAWRNGRSFDVRGIHVDLDAMIAPQLAAYRDPDRIKEEIAALERDVKRYTGMLAAAKQAAALRDEKAALENEAAKLIRELAAYDAFLDDSMQEPQCREDLAALQAREKDLLDAVAAHEIKRLELAGNDQRNRADRVEVIRRRTEIQDQVRSLSAPADAWPLQSLEDIPSDMDELCVRYRKVYAEEQIQAEQVTEILESIELKTGSRYAVGDEADTIQALQDQLDSIPQRERAVEEMWKGIAVGIKKDLQNIGKDLDTLKGLISGLNRKLGAVNISNLASLKLLIEEWPQWVKLIREITVDDEMPLFGNPNDADEAFSGIGRLLADYPRVDQKDLFNLAFEIGTPEGRCYRHEHLDAIESNGTTMAIKVLVNLVLLRSLLGSADVQIPFYLDECSSLDQTNLAAIVNTARQMGFIAVLASPEAMDAAEKLYFIEEQKDGRVVLDPRTAMVRIQKNPGSTEDPGHA